MDRPDIPRLIGDLMRFGTIESVDFDAATCRVRAGDIVTGDIPWITRAGRITLWAPPSIGEQCVLFTPEGDQEAAFALSGLFSTAFPSPATNADLTLIAFADGARLSYDQAAHTLAVALPAGGRITLTAPAGVAIEGDVAIEGKVDIRGDVAIDGKLDATGDLTGQGVSLKTHRHKDVQAGGAISGPPQ
ncbi:phage baseplate assembly protein V [Sphingomonas sp.]|uniref:phage baseplate assembly protein V n=1 Tax=Sphingomonas sp. TaxID=28214 RepID=UPI003B3A1A8A